jgi:uncharacterized protein (DUF433 family)
MNGFDETLVPKSPPLHMLEDGTIRVCGSRIPLDTLFSMYEMGNAPESVVSSFPSLSLGQVHSVFAYIAENRDFVDKYIEVRNEQAEVIRKEIQKRWPTEGLKEKLLARKAQMELAKH